MSAPPQQDLDRLAAALARLLADWWLRQAGATAVPRGGLSDDPFEVATAPERQGEAPAPTGADEIHPEHHTRKDTIS
jgi:hypothetical protein